MKTNVFGGVLAILLLAAAFVGYLSLFTVYQTQQALVVRLGDPIRKITEPGLHAKLPLIDTVIYVDNRILDLENAAQEVIASDQKRLVVDAFARYRIIDPLLFYQSVEHDRRRQFAPLDAAQFVAAPGARRSNADPCGAR